MKRIILAAAIALTASLSGFARASADTVATAAATVAVTADSDASAAAADSAAAAPYTTYTYFSNETDTLVMDVYSPADDTISHRCIVWIYGGGFKDNNLRSASARKFCTKLASDGFVVCAIDYRLGLKGYVMKGKAAMVKPLLKSVEMATEDCFRATRYIIDNAASLRVDPGSIVLIGSSAGAITALQADYELGNRTSLAAGLPSEFRYAGIVSFAGGICSLDGKPRYRVHEPAPTFLLHGISDNIVTYDKISVAGKGLYGSSAVVKQFQKYGYPYYIKRFVLEGHGVAMRQMKCYDDVIWFIDTMVTAGRDFRRDETVYDVGHKRQSWEMNPVETLYKK